MFVVSIVKTRHSFLHAVNSLAAKTYQRTKSGELLDTVVTLISVLELHCAF